MSLLLDALKKAAKDKQDAASEDVTAQNETERADVADADEALVLDRQQEDELVLNLEDSASPEESSPTPVASEEELTLEPAEVNAATSTVSDEALQMLVHKTNREFQHKQKAIWFSAAFVSVIVLLLGGYYFYSNMVQDVEALERKHRIALQKVNAEVIKRKNPKVVADLAPGVQLNQQQPQTSTAASQKTSAVKQAPAKARPQSRDTGKAINNDNYSFAKTEKEDPVSSLLDAGWKAYNDGDYELARRSYENALAREANNRDALLGIAATAIKQDRMEEAIKAYSYLVELDPRDPIAVAELANLKNQSINNLGESKLKQLLRQQPDAAHINFALGNISADKQAWPQAQQYYFDAWQSDSGNADYAFNLAISLDQIGKREQAKKFYSESIKLAASQNQSFSIDAASQRLQQLSE